MNGDGPGAVIEARSQQLIRHLAQLRLNGLSAGVVREARMRLLDGLGCGLYGAQKPWARIMADVAYAEKSQGNCTVYGRSELTTATRAALCNGTATHGIELDDILDGAHLHPGGVVVPAILAAAEQHGASGERLLLGLVAGYETLARVGRALGEGEASWSFHYTGVAGPVGAAVAVGVLRGFPHEQIVRAVGIACCTSAGLKSFTQGSGGMTKRMHAGRAAESGVLACLLSERGFTAPLAAIDGRFGLLEGFGGGKADPEQLVTKLGQDYMSNVWTKVYPCCGALHTAAQASKSLRDEHQLQVADISKIRIGTGRRVIAMSGGVVAPKETMAAQYSLPFVAAVGLASDVKDPRSFEGSALDDPNVLGLAHRVELYVDPEIEALYPRYAIKIEIHLSNGTKVKTKLLNAHGMPDDPCSEDEVKQKFRRLASASLDGNAIESVLNVVERIEQLPSVAPLSAALHCGK